MTQDLDLIPWAAGLFEGEGCVYANPQKRGRCRPQVRLKLAMTDFEPVLRFLDVVGCGYVKIEHRKNPRHADVLIWRCDRQADVEYVVNLLGPHLCSRRTAQVRAAQAKRLQWSLPSEEVVQPSQ
jgi:hypothetical protein